MMAGKAVLLLVEAGRSALDLGDGAVHGCADLVGRYGLSVKSRKQQAKGQARVHFFPRVGASIHPRSLRLWQCIELVRDLPGGFAAWFNAQIDIRLLNSSTGR